MSKSNAKKSASGEAVPSVSASAEPVVMAVVDSPLAQQPEKESKKPKKAAADKVAAKAEKSDKAVKAGKADKAEKAGKAKAEKNDTAEGKDKPKKAKLVRDSFTIPETEYKVLAEVKRACLKAGFEVKKSELIRIGLALVQQTEPLKLQQVLAGLPSLKAGRPKKDAAQA